jgi:hypothetical protein
VIHSVDLEVFYIAGYSQIFPFLGRKSHYQPVFVMIHPNSKALKTPQDPMALIASMYRQVDYPGY